MGLAGVFTPKGKADNRYRDRDSDGGEKRGRGRSYQYNLA